MHLFTLDTILLGGGVSTIIARRTKLMLKDFLAALGAKINDRRSKIYGWNYPLLKLQQIVGILWFFMMTNGNPFNTLAYQSL